MKKFTPIFLLFSLSFMTCFGQSNLHVSNTGSDISGNGTLSNPYKTIEKGADAAEVLINTNPTTPVTVLVRQGLYRNSGFTTNSTLSVNDYAPETIGEAIWKSNSSTGNAIQLNNINGNSNAWITIRPYNNETVVIECDGDIAFNIRNCSFLKVEGFEIKGVSEKIPIELAWKYWGTYRYLSNGNFVYGDRKQDICALYNLSNCSDIPPNVLTTGITYVGLPNIQNLDVERPKIFIGKGVLVNLSHHIEIKNCDIHHFPGGGLRVTGSDYVVITGNQVHHSSNRASVGTHGLVIEGLDPDSGDNSAIQKCLISNNTVYSNYNELYSWVQTKVICTTVIDEGKGIVLLRTGSINGFNGIIKVENNICYDNGKSGIHCNDVDNAQIVNNTVYNNAHTNVYNPTLSGGNQAGISIQSSNNIKIINNISVVPNGLSPQVKALSEGQNCNGEIVMNNIVFGGTTSDFVGGYQAVNPLFSNPTNFDFGLQSNSSAINTANAVFAPNYDFYNLTRDVTPDKGAVEFRSGPSTTVSAKLFIEGYYDASQHAMKSVLSNQLYTIPSTNVDYVTIELINPTNNQLVASINAILQTNGLVSAVFPLVISGSYYLQIKHRNAIKTCSKMPITINSSNMIYDFSNAQTKAFGDNLTQVEPNVWAFYSGDINQDGNVDNSDYSIWETNANNFVFGDYTTDLNGDGNVDNTDYSIWESNANNFISNIIP